MKQTKGTKKPYKSSTNPKKKGSATDLIGIMGKAPADFDYKEELFKILEEKYLKNN
jgi:hypothetical protein